jgi:hypothetical protein
MPDTSLAWGSWWGSVVGPDANPTTRDVRWRPCVRVRVQPPRLSRVALVSLAGTVILLPVLHVI